MTTRRTAQDDIMAGLSTWVSNGYDGRCQTSPTDDSRALDSLVGFPGESRRNTADATRRPAVAPASDAHRRTHERGIRLVGLPRASMAAHRAVPRRPSERGRGCDEPAVRVLRRLYRWRRVEDGERRRVVAQHLRHALSYRLDRRDRRRDRKSVV